MGKRKWRLWLGEPASLVLMALAAGALAQVKADVLADHAKGLRIEPPTKAVVAAKSGPLALASGNFRNPKVEPGIVHWHPTLAAACAAARHSGKPVLLFQMMGKLDEQFC